ncbi:MAG TPA: ABC transporter permease [Blastocatellia bacterium]|nr:ABC transporter permease [Blastocatellia bacterium]
MQILLRDLSYGVRILLKYPGFTLIAIITLGLGIGVNTALFAGFNLLVRPSPIKDPDTVVKIERESEDTNRNFSYFEYVYFRDHTQTLSDFLPTIEEKLLLREQITGAEPVEIKGIFASDNYLVSLGGSMRLGRFFTPEENRVEGRDAVVVLSHYFWEHRFAGNGAVVGQTLLLNGTAFTVIGVTSPDFVGLQIEMPDLWLPLMMRSDKSTVHFADPKSRDRDWFGDQEFQWLSLHARVKPGKTVSEAQAELALLQNQLPRAAVMPGPKRFISVAPAFGAIGIRSFWIKMAVVLGASGLVLLIACSNIANMLLARAVARQKEIGVRMALGASRWRVIRQLMTESFLLAISGGAAGTLLARWSVELLFPWVFERSDGRNFAKTALSLSIDWRVLVFAMLLSLLSGVAFGLVPAMRATRPDLIAVVKDDHVAFGGRLARSWLRNGLVVAQVALCFVLLIPAGLLLRALMKVFTTDRGYETNKLLVVEYKWQWSGKGAHTAQEFQQQLISRLAALPGVRSVCPQHDLVERVMITLPDERGPVGEKNAGNQFEQVPFQWVTAGYLDTIGTPLILGRGFTVEEVDLKMPVIIVSQSTARNLWPGQNPLDKVMRIEQRQSDGSDRVIMKVAKVIGVARDNQIYRPGHVPPLVIYAPQRPFIEVFRQLLVRSERDAASLKELARKEAFALEPSLVLTVGTMESVFGEASIINSARVASELAIALGGLALLLATLGLYGVMAFSVAQRAREIGVRMALGAQAGQVRMLVTGQGMKLVLIGVLIGVPISMAVSKVVKSLLFGMSTRDPVTYGVVALLLAISGLTACWMPARRAAKVDPMVALRSE